VKLPTEAANIRDEISAAGPSTVPPGRLLDLVTAFTRGAPVQPVIVLNTQRVAYQLCDRDDRVAVEVVDDSVTVHDGRRAVLKFREIEAERKHGRAKLLDRVEATLRDAGAVVGDFTPKYVRALGLPAMEPPDWPAPPSRLPKRPTAADVVAAALRRDIHRIISHDPLVRLRAPVGVDDTAVHQMRVGCRRLRSDLRTFASLVNREWSARLRTELGWLAAALGLARDAEVLRERLRHTANADGLAPLDAVAVARIDADLTARHEDALAALDKVMGQERYHRLLDLLLAAAREPQLAGRADEPADLVLPGATAWRGRASSTRRGRTTAGTRCASRASGCATRSRRSPACSAARRAH
jgi:inorganic triphosphatase YgiF